MSETQNKPGFFDGNPKMIFVFGLVTGIALTSLFGNGITLPSLGKSENTVVRQFDTGTTVPTDAAPAGELAAVTDSDHVLGDINKAKVVIVEYSDFECPFCARHHPTMKQAVADFGDDVAWVYRHFPLSFHPQAVPSALASECAAEQGKFWEYGDKLFENQAALNDTVYAQIAKDLKLNTKKFDDCYSSKKYLEKVNADMATGRTAGVSGTPATFVNGTLVSGAVPYETLRDAISSYLE